MKWHRMVLLDYLVFGVKRIVLIALALAAAYFYARWQGERVAHANTRTTMATASMQSAANATATTTKLQKDKDHAMQIAAKRAQSHRADADGARAELDRLRQTLPAVTAESGANTIPATPDRADPARELLGICAGALTEMAGTADRLNADRLTLLDAWPRQKPGD